jgi:hypothetical protein
LAIPRRKASEKEEKKGEATKKEIKYCKGKRGGKENGENKKKEEEGGRSEKRKSKM